MKAMPASHSVHDNSTLEESEFALAISPCPRIEGSKDIEEDADRLRQAQTSRETGFDDYDLTETLTIGWSIAFAIAVAVVVYVSGG